MSTAFARGISSALSAVVTRLLPGSQLLEVSAFGTDAAGEADEGTTKGAGYGHPLKLRVLDAQGGERRLVFHTAGSDIFGHDRRADRAAEMLLGYDTFDKIPGHVRALDVGAIERDGAGLLSLASAGEFYLITSYADGHLYADELRRIAHAGKLLPDDTQHCETLARYLADLHSESIDDPSRYRRALRDLVGSGEGIFGIVDGYPDDVPGAPRERLQKIEASALEWRWALRDKSSRLARTHGDFHPFNLLFDDKHQLSLLDASRGCLGDPADDVACLALNYVFFSVERPATWAAGFRSLWQRFFQVYREQSGDAELFRVLAPFLAWRGLVVANPVWYPGVDAAARDRVLKLIERTLAAPAFDPDFADAVFA